MSFTVPRAVFREVETFHPRHLPYRPKLGGAHPSVESTKFRSGRASSVPPDRSVQLPMDGKGQAAIFSTRYPPSSEVNTTTRIPQCNRSSEHFSQGLANRVRPQRSTRATYAVSPLLQRARAAASAWSEALWWSMWGGLRNLLQACPMTRDPSAITQPTRQRCALVAATSIALAMKRSCRGIRWTKRSCVPLPAARLGSPSACLRTARSGAGPAGPACCAE
jgi:hypothetical protein